MSRFRPRAWSKSNSSRLLRAGNRAARMRPSPPWDSRAATSRCRQATRNSSCDQDSSRARAASRSTDSRSVGAFSARVRNAISASRSRAFLAAGAAITPPRRRRRPARRRRPGCAARPPARPPGAARSTRCRRSPAAAALCSGSVIAWCQAQARSWSATSLPAAEGPDPVQPGDHLDPPADHGRVDRVVVGVQADVVVAGQPRRGPPPGRRRDRRQGQHRGRSAAIRSAGAQPSARRGRPVDRREPLRQLGVEVRRGREPPARQERGLQVAVGPLDQPLGLRVGRAADHHPAPRVPRNAWHSAVSSGFPARHRPIAPSPSQTSARGTAPSAAISCHQPANRSSRVTGRDQHRRQPPRIAADHRQDRQPRRTALLPEPDRHRDRREPEVALRELART